MIDFEQRVSCHCPIQLRARDGTASTSTSARANARILGRRPIEYRGFFFAIAAVLPGFCTGARGDDLPATFERVGAREAVHDGNQLLLKGDAPKALKAYAHAKTLRPDALQIPFVEGLGHYALKEYEEARESFEKAAVSKNRKLADDATYSVGTTYHAEALQGADDPQLAIEKLENAMQRYQNVLANQPGHREARDAIVKAASMRRQLKRMLEQQQQQQEQDQDQDQQNDEDNPEDQQEEQEGQDQNEQDDKQQSKSQQEQSNDQSQNEKQSAEQDEQQKNESEASQGKEDDEQQEQAAKAEQQKQTSREQAQRQLREMMQDMHERKKRHRQELQPYRVVPVDKDW